MGTAYVRGLQAEDLRHGVICTGKHFLGYAMSEGGMNHAPVQLGPRELREVYAEPFAAAIRDAGLASIMNSYSSVDGLPCGGAGRSSRPPPWRAGLRRRGGGRLLRRRPAAALPPRRTAAGATPALARCGRARPGAAGARLLRRHADRSSPTGRLPVAVVDGAVRRVPGSKFQVGLFENPYVDADRRRGRVRHPLATGPWPAERRPKSIVLLAEPTDASRSPSAQDAAPSSRSSARRRRARGCSRATTTTPRISRSRSTQVAPSGTHPVPR